MTCARCPFSLLCYTQRLMHIDRLTQTYFCPVCKKLIHIHVSLNSVIAYVFSCEKCTLSLPEIEEQWEKRGRGTVVITVNNPLYDLHPKSPVLAIMCCPKCADTMDTYIGLKCTKFE